jgi:hypothetical protein
MIVFDIGKDLLIPHPATHKSSYCFVAYNPKLERILQEVYGRSGLCLKVFKRPLGKHTPYTFGWGKKPLYEVTKVQNLMARRGIAPRVYDLVKVNGHAAQVTQFIEPNGQDPTLERLKELIAEYRIKSRKGWDIGERNWVGDQFVDFSGFYFSDRNWYAKQLTNRAHTRRDRYIGVAYQAVLDLGIKGTRNNQHRIDVLQLDKIDFKGKTVLDIGCNLGAFSRYAHGRQAKRIVGVDRIADLTFEINNWLGYFNVDFITARLPGDVAKIKELSGIEKFDIVLCLAAIKHISGWGEWLKNLCDDIYIFEGHGGVKQQYYENMLASQFSSFEYLGKTNDNYSRVAFRCKV